MTTLGAVVTEIDPVSNWLQVVLQGGSLGLLAIALLVVGPRIADKVMALMAQRDKQHAETITLLESKFDERNERLVGAIEKQTERITEQMKDRR